MSEEQMRAMARKMAEAPAETPSWQTDEMRRVPDLRRF